LGCRRTPALLLAGADIVVVAELVGYWFLMINSDLFGPFSEECISELNFMPTAEVMVLYSSISNIEIEKMDKTRFFKGVNISTPP